MSETTIQTGIQTAIRAMSEFDNADVVINDWSILDQSSSAAPYVIIENADEFTSKQDTVTPDNTWQIQVTLIERFDNWKSSLDNLRTRRQAIIDKINTDTIRSAGGLANVTIDEVRAGGPIGYIYNRYLTDEQMAEALPAFLSQLIILSAEEF